MEKVPNKPAPEIKAIKERITSLYDGKPLDRVPFFFNVGNYQGFSTDRALEDGRTAARTVKDHQFHLAEQIKGFRKKLESGFQDDSLLALNCCCGVGTIASAFGCPTRFFEDTLPWTEHVVEDPRDIVHLKPDIAKAEILNLALEKAFYFREQAGPDIPIALPDIQGPIDTAGIIMKDTSLFEAVYTHPQEVHLLLKMVTETLIETVRAFERKVPNIFCHSHANWLPYGIHLSDDYLPVLSPKIYQEFVVPYNQVIAKEFGGIFLHSCGNYVHQAANLLGTKGLLGVDFHEFPINRLAEKTNDGIVLVSAFVDDAYTTFAEITKNTRAETLGRSWADLEKLPGVKTKRIIFCGNCLEEEKAGEYYQKMTAYLKN